MDETLEATARGIFARAKAIIMTPKDEWPKIATETTSQSDLLLKYVLPLAAIGPVASFIGGQVFGYGAFGFSYRPGLIAGLATAIVSFVLSLVSLFVLTFIADLLAPKFAGESNRAQAFKLVAYSYTAGWAAGVFGIIPMLAFFGLLGLYSVYLLYTGATPLMKVPEDKAAGYTAVTILCAIVLSIIVTPITAAITGVLGMGAMSMVGNTDSGGKFTVPGGGTFDTSKVDAMTKQIESAANGKTQPIDAAKMQALLPASIGSYQRTATESTGMGAIGSEADGTYTAGDNSFHLKITDMSAMGAIAGLGAAMGVSNSREDANGYERTGTVNGQMQSESWNKTDSSGKFSVVVANRFMIEAQGKATSVDVLKAAVATVDQGNLLSLAG
ncbi:MAG: Yip1 family protein [Novosphingobium sp.]